MIARDVESTIPIVLKQRRCVVFAEVEEWVRILKILRYVMCTKLKQIEQFIIRRHISKLLLQAKCADTNGNAIDKDGYDCDRYRVRTINDPKMCGKYDDQDFKAKEMCCICGGGRFGNIKSHFANKLSLKW